MVFIMGILIVLLIIIGYTIGRYDERDKERKRKGIEPKKHDPDNSDDLSV